MVLIGDDCFIIPSGYGGGLGGRVGNRNMALRVLRMQYLSLRPFAEDTTRSQSTYISLYENTGLVDALLRYKGLDNVYDEELLSHHTAYREVNHADRMSGGYDIYEVGTGAKAEKFYDYALNLTFSRKYISHLDDLVSAVRQKIQP